MRPPSTNPRWRLLGRTRNWNFAGLAALSFRSASALPIAKNDREANVNTATRALQKRQLQAQRRLQLQGKADVSGNLQDTPPRQDQPLRNMSSVEQQQDAQNQ